MRHNKFVLSVFVYFSFISFGFSSQLECELERNFQNLTTQKIELKGNEKTLFATDQSFSFFVTQLNHRKFEIEIYDSIGITRQYASGTLDSADDNLSWELWSQNDLLGIHCRRLTQ